MSDEIELFAVAGRGVRYHRDGADMAIEADELGELVKYTPVEPVPDHLILAPGEAISTPAAQVFDAAAFASLPAGAVVFNEDDSITFDPAFFPDGFTHVFAPLPGRPYLVPLLGQRRAVNLSSLWTLPAQAATGGVARETGVLLGLGREEEGQALDVIYGGVVRHPSIASMCSTAGADFPGVVRPLFLAGAASQVLWVRSEVHLDANNRQLSLAIHHSPGGDFSPGDVPTGTNQGYDEDGDVSAFLSSFDERWGFYLRLGGADASPWSAGPFTLHALHIH